MKILSHMSPAKTRSYSEFFLILPVILALILPHQTFSQQNEDNLNILNKRRLNTFLIATGTVYGGTLIALNKLWYSDHPKESFHFFDDSGEWMQVDKVGHFYSTFHLSQTGSKSFQWAGLSQRKSVLWGSALGFALMMPIEFMDGFSSEYGASSSDLMANFLGSAFYLGQDLAWGETRIHPKYSFSKSGLSGYRPDILGRNTREQLFKDYNGQTYWLSFDLHSLAGFKIKWLNLALGYGADNMVNASGSPIASFPYQAFRQYYLGLDIDLTHIQSSSKVVNTLLYLANMIRLPAPALELNSSDKLIFHPIIF